MAVVLLWLVVGAIWIRNVYLGRLPMRPWLAKLAIAAAVGVALELTGRAGGTATAWIVGVLVMLPLVLEQFGHRVSFRGRDLPVAREVAWILHPFARWGLDRGRQRVNAGLVGGDMELVARGIEQIRRADPAIAELVERHASVDFAGVVEAIERRPPSTLSMDELRMYTRALGEIGRLDEMASVFLARVQTRNDPAASRFELAAFYGATEVACGGAGRDVGFWCLTALQRSGDPDGARSMSERLARVDDRDEVLIQDRLDRPLAPVSTLEFDPELRDRFLGLCTRDRFLPFGRR